MLNDPETASTDDLAAARAAKRPRLDSESKSNPPASSPSSSRASSYRLKLSVQGHKKAISSVAFSPNGQYLVSSCESLYSALAVSLRRAVQADHSCPHVPAGDTPIHLHSLPSFHLYRSFNSHTAGVSHVSFSADSTLLASASDDKTVRIWELDPTLSLSHRALGVLGSEETKPEEMAIRVLKGHLSAVFCVGWSPRGDLIASGGMDETVRVWDVQKGEISVSLVSYFVSGTRLIDTCCLSLSEVNA